MRIGLVGILWISSMGILWRHQVFFLSPISQIIVICNSASVLLVPSRDDRIPELGAGGHPGDLRPTRLNRLRAALGALRGGRSPGFQRGAASHRVRQLPRDARGLASEPGDIEGVGPGHQWQRGGSPAALPVEMAPVVKQLENIGRRGRCVNRSSHGKSRGMTDNDR